MQVGCFGGLVFSVDSNKVFTMQDIQGSTGSDWATHNRTGARARSQWIAPKLRKYQFDLLLRAQDGVNPRSVLRHFQRMAETNAADCFIVGGSPVSPYPFKITDISDEWGAVLHGGAMVECKVSLTIEEYL
mgnify:CR=1 FL=1